MIFFRKKKAATQGWSKEAKLPLLIWTILILTIITLIGDFSFAGKQVTGWAWIIPFIISLFMITSRFSKLSFPFLIWLSWTITVLWYLAESDFVALQRSTQLLCPVVIGLGASTLRPADAMLNRLLEYLRKMTYWIWAGVILKTGIILTGTLPMTTGLAPEVMTVILLCALFAASYGFGNSKDIIWWAALSLVPFIAVTRTAIAVTGMTFPLTFAPMKLRRRMIILMIIGIVGLGMFYSPRLQGKMFLSGKGTVSDVLDRNFVDSGRFFMWQRFEERIGDNPWFGHGAGAGEAYSYEITRGQSGYPHNDWLLTLYDYGVFGTAIYALSLALAALHAYRTSTRAGGLTRIFMIAGASAFLPYAVMMYTDNIMVYISFFGNLQFLMLGLAYGAYARDKQIHRSQYSGHRR